MGVANAATYAGRGRQLLRQPRQLVRDRRVALVDPRGGVARDLVQLVRVPEAAALRVELVELARARPERG